MVNEFKRTSLRFHLALLAIFVSLLGSAVPEVQSQALAQVGPEAPVSKKPATASQPPVADKLKDSFKKFFTAPATSDQKQADTTGVKPDPSNPATQGDDPAYPDVAAKSDKSKAEASQQQQEQQLAPQHAPMLTQPPLTTVRIEDPVSDPNKPPKGTLRLDDPKNPLGFASMVNQLKLVDDLIKQKKVVEARAILTPLRQWLIDCTEAHIGLYNTLNKVPTARAQAEFEKQVALEFAQLRDRSMFELGLLLIEEKDYKKAVKELTEVIKSQPRSKTGVMAYELLQEIGFTEQLQLSPQ